MKQPINQLIINPKNIFLLDGIGALVSAFFLGVVLVQFQHHIGMPVYTLYLLGGLALGFVLYSTSCYLLFPKNWKPFLKLIATVNFLYCLLTIGLMMHFFQELTAIGITYFLAEIIIIVLIVRLEFKIAFRNKESHSL